MKSAQRSRLVFVAFALAAFALVGCGPAPWSTAPSGAASPSGTVVPTPVPNDLSSGTTQREVIAGAVTATVDYWSTLSMDRWTPDAVKPVSLSMTTAVTPADGQKVYLQKATMLAVPSSATETFPALDPQVDSSTVSPGYLVLAPYSFSQTFNVGPVPAETTFVTLQFTYDFLVQTTPTSSDYAKQTATDTLTIAVAG